MTTDDSTAAPLDPEIAAFLRARPAPDGPLPGGDGIPGLRALNDFMLATTFERIPHAEQVSAKDFFVSTGDGGEILLRWYSRADSTSPAAVVYLHGGGMIAGSVATYDRAVRHYVQLTGVPFLAVDYRLAPEVGGTTLAEDAVRGLQWLVDNAGDLGVDPARIAVMGDSGGGGVAAGAAILARERGLALRRQILVYPMLDDRTTTPDPRLAPVAFWGYENNRVAWHAVLGDRIGTADVPPAAAPGRLTDFTGLAPAYVEVGELDIFRDETIAYAQGLMLGGVSCELHVWPGAPHGYDWIELGTSLSQRSLAARVSAIAAL